MLKELNRWSSEKIKITFGFFCCAFVVCDIEVHAAKKEIIKILYKFVFIIFCDVFYVNKNLTRFWF